MTYVTAADAQGWLQVSKYGIEEIADEQVSAAVNTVFSKLSRRYDVDLWTNDSNTPQMVLDILTMLVASYTLRKSISEDDGIANYCDWLEGRAMSLVDGLAEGLLEIPGTDPSADTPEEGTPAFWPTQAATDLWFEDPNAEGAAARAFDMQKVF